MMKDLKGCPVYCQLPSWCYFCPLSSLSLLRGCSSGVRLQWSPVLCSLKWSPTSAWSSNYTPLSTVSLPHGHNLSLAHLFFAVK